MKRMVFYMILSFSILISSINLKAEEDFPVLKGPYLGQKPPGKKAVCFDPGIFPEGESLGCSGFLKDGTVFVFTAARKGSDWRLRPIYITELKNGRWTKLKLTPFSSYFPYNFTVGPDDLTLYFTTLKSPDKTTSMFMEQANIWAVMLHLDHWSEPMMLGRSINTEKYYENYPAVTNEGTIYYMSRREQGVGRTDVWKSKNIDGKYSEAQNLGSPINTTGSDIDPFVAADESYLIVCQKLAGAYGLYDLYVYFKKQNGSWSQAFNLGKEVNSSSYETRPYVTPDGKFLFFTSSRPINKVSQNRIFWVDARIIEELKPKEFKRMANQ